MGGAFGAFQTEALHTGKHTEGRAYVGQNSLLTGVAGGDGEGVCFEFLTNLGMGWGDGKVGPC